MTPHTSGMKSLLLCGFYSAGKTTIGVQCALKLKVPFIDTDQLLEEVYCKKPRDLWKERGEEAFRELEQKILYSLEDKPQVIALGGGALLRNEKKIKTLGSLVYLKARADTLYQRIEKRGFPAFFKDKQEFEKLANIRFPLYEKASDWVLETDALTENEIVDRICSQYGK